MARFQRPPPQASIITLPWPIETVDIPKVTSENQLNIGYRPLNAGRARNVPEESLSLTGDENIVDIDFTVFWVIKDATAFLFNVDNQGEDSGMNSGKFRHLNMIGPQEKGGCGTNDESRHFMLCQICGQVIDMRSVPQTVHHNEPEHVPLTETELAELAG